MLKHPLLYVWIVLVGAFALAGLINKRPAEQRQEWAAQSKQPSETKNAERIPSAAAEGAHPKKDQGAADKSGIA